MSRSTRLALTLLFVIVLTMPLLILAQNDDDLLVPIVQQNDNTVIINGTPLVIGTAAPATEELIEYPTTRKLKLTFVRLHRRKLIQALFYRPRRA